MGELCISGGLTIKNEADDLKSLHGMAEMHKWEEGGPPEQYIKIKLYMKRGDIYVLRQF